MNAAIKPKSHPRGPLIAGFHSKFGDYDAAGLRRISREQKRGARRDIRYATATPIWRGGARARKEQRAGAGLFYALLAERCATLVERRAEKERKKKIAKPKEIRFRNVPFKEVAKAWDEVEAIQRATG